MTTMQNVITASIALFIAISLLSGCSNKPIGGHEYELGAAYNAQLASQKFDPTPAGNDPVVTLNGELAKTALDRQRSQQTKETGPRFGEVMLMEMTESQHSN